MKIKEFKKVSFPNLTSFENIKIQNRSNHPNEMHQVIFTSIEDFVLRVIKDIHNIHSTKLFKDNYLNIVSDEATIEEFLISGLKEKGMKVTSLNNPEMIYRAFNFIRPDNLIPKFNSKLYLIKQLGINETGKETTYVLNPYFFGFKISLHIYVNCLLCNQFDKELQAGLLKILTDKYGDEYGYIYDYVSNISNSYGLRGRQKGDEEDETFIEGIKSISGLEDDEIIQHFVYEPAMILATSNHKILKDIK